MRLVVALRCVGGGVAAAPTPPHWIDPPIDRPTVLACLPSLIRLIEPSLFLKNTRRNETRDAIEAGLKAAAEGDEGAVTFCITRRGEDGTVRGFDFD